MATITKKATTKGTVAKKTAKKSAPKKAAAKKAAAKAARGNWSDDRKVTFVENPGREGSAAYKIFEAAKSCKTIGQVRAKAGKLGNHPGHLTILFRFWKENGAMKVA